LCRGGCGGHAPWLWWRGRLPRRVRQDAGWCGSYQSDSLRSPDNSNRWVPLRSPDNSNRWVAMCSPDDRRRGWLCARQTIGVGGRLYASQTTGIGGALRSPDDKRQLTSVVSQLATPIAPFGHVLSTASALLRHRKSEELQLGTQELPQSGKIPRIDRYQTLSFLLI